MIPKFRAWYKDEQKMYEVLAIYFGLPYGIDADNIVNFVALHGKKGTHVEGEDVELLQYIGRKDKHNTDVCNGDIIKTGPVKIERIGEPFVGRIYWHEHEFQWWITDDTQDPIVGIDYDVTFLDNYQDFEVIGNNYEHSHLLRERTP